MHLTNLAAISSLFAIASAADFAISVGAFQNGTAAKVYDPNNIQAAVGDTLTFTFHPANHTVSQSTFGSPCALMPPNATAGTSGGLDTGFMPVAAGSTTFPTVTINVTDTKPLWFYCRQATHCQSGMVMAVNAPATGNTFAAFLANAEGPAGATASASGAATVTGGSGSGVATVAGGSGTSTAGSSSATGSSSGSSRLTVGAFGSLIALALALAA